MNIETLLSKGNANFRMDFSNNLAHAKCVHYFEKLVQTHNEATSTKRKFKVYFKDF